jgi:hypothetical protein
MMLLGNVSMLSGAGLGDDVGCTSAVSSMSVGQYCTLPDGSNLATWSGTQLVNPSGGPIDSVNAAALIAAGWPAQQVSGGAGTANQQATASGAASGQPWWATGLTALTKGITAGAVSPPVTAMPGTLPVVAPAWYETPLGIGALLAGLGLVWYLFKD